MTATPPVLLSHHARMLFEESGIDPVVAARRGCRSVAAAECAALGFAPYQYGDGLLIPEHTLAGIQLGCKLRRDRPRSDDKGKPIKYESPEGVPTHFDIHPDAAPLLRDASVPLDFTEGVRKSDALWSRGRLCISLSGVFAFLRGRLVVPDLDEIDLNGRHVRVIFDSDVTRKQGVAEALLRLCAALHRRGARVAVIYLPEGPDGEKVGLDDFLAGGGTPAELDALARPWKGEGPGVRLLAADEDDDDLRRQRDAARDDYAALAQAVLNPEVSRAQLVAVTSATAQVLAKQRRGEVEPDGTVILSAAEIADDWRSAPAPGERVAPTNPSGNRPRLARERVRTIIAPAVDLGLIRAAPRPVRRHHANGSTYTDTEWVFDPIPSIAAALSPWGAYRPAEPTVRKPRSTAPPCPVCGEVHPIARRDACTGCGAILAEKTIAPAPAPASDNLSEAETMVRVSPPAAPRNVVRSFIGGKASSAMEPAWLADVPDPDADNAPPPLAAVRPTLAAADHAADRERLHRAQDDLRTRLEPIAAARGRVPVPKPPPSPSFLPHMPAEAGADEWTR